MRNYGLKELTFLEIDEWEGSYALNVHILENRRCKKGTFFELIRFSTDSLPNKDAEQTHHILSLNKQE